MCRLYLLCLVALALITPQSLFCPVIDEGGRRLTRTANFTGLYANLSYRLLDMETHTRRISWDSFTITAQALPGIMRRPCAGTKRRRTRE